MTDTEFAEIQPVPRIAVLGLSMAMLLASLGTSIANVALPALALAFEAPFTLVQWVVVAYFVTLTVCTVVAGRLGDRIGLRRVMLGGLALYALAAGLCSIAPGIWALILFRGLQGIAAAALMVTTIALVRETMGPDRVGRAMGLLGTMSAVGTALGPSLGGVLLAFVGWRAVFFAPMPLALGAMAMVLAYVPPDRSRPRDGALSLAMLKDPKLAVKLGSNMAVAAVMMSTLIVGPFVLSIPLDLSEAMVGLVMSVGPVIAALSGVPSGRLVDSWGSGRIMLAGLAIMVAGTLALAVLPELMGVWGFLVATVILTPGYQLFLASNNTSVMEDVPADRRGMASGFLNLSRNIGFIVGAWGMGALFALGAGRAAVEQATAQAVLNGMRLTFAVAAGMMLAALLLNRRTG